MDHSRLSPPQEKSGWCTPLIIYLVLAGFGLLGTLFSSNTGAGKTTNMLFSLFWTLFWGVIMYQLCKNGHEGWSWFILLLPIAIWFIVLLLLFLGVIVIG